jgi:hypothetical protein
MGEVGAFGIVAHQRLARSLPGHAEGLGDLPASFRALSIQQVEDLHGPRPKILGPTGAAGVLAKRPSADLGQALDARLAALFLGGLADFGDAPLAGPEGPGNADRRQAEDSPPPADLFAPDPDLPADAPIAGPLGHHLDQPRAAGVGHPVARLGQPQDLGTPPDLDRRLAELLADLAGRLPAVPLADHGRILGGPAGLGADPDPLRRGPDRLDRAPEFLGDRRGRLPAVVPPQVGQVSGFPSIAVHRISPSVA